MFTHDAAKKLVDKKSAPILYLPHIHMAYHNVFTNIDKGVFMLHFFLCWYASDGVASYFDFRYKEHLYKVFRKYSVHEGYSWYEAKDYCSKLGINASLAVFGSAKEKVRKRTFSLSQSLMSVLINQMIYILYLSA